MHIVSAGLQTTLQGAPRRGWRHYGVPASGPADALSMALANRLVGNPCETTALEITLGGFEAETDQPISLAVTGAVGEFLIDGHKCPLHQTIQLNAGCRLKITPPIRGMRAYLAVPGGFSAETQFGSTSTYLPAGFGGHAGRCLQSGDVLQTEWQLPQISQDFRTPEQLKPIILEHFALQACESAETDRLHKDAVRVLFETQFRVAQQVTRMGFELTGPRLKGDADGRMKSAAVYPGTVQCPPSGRPILLACDAQTTGGYPRIAQIARCDRHSLGQVRPGAKLRLLRRTPSQAEHIYTRKTEFLRSWLSDLRL